MCETWKCSNLVTMLQMKTLWPAGAEQFAQITQHTACYWQYQEQILGISVTRSWSLAQPALVAFLAFGEPSLLRRIHVVPESWMKGWDEGQQDASLLLISVPIPVDQEYTSRIWFPVLKSGDSFACPWHTLWNRERQRGSRSRSPVFAILKHLWFKALGQVS